jgi:hypothetical protein
MVTLGALLGQDAAEPGKHVEQAGEQPPRELAEATCGYTSA